jgi:prepilin-type processing-associated H-X9-DG protein
MRRRIWVRRVGFGLLAFAVLLSPWEWSLARAMTAKSTDSEQARVAEWVRGHGGGSFVTWAENLQYKLHPPKVGGTPAANSPLLRLPAPSAGAPAAATTASPEPTRTGTAPAAKKPAPFRLANVQPVVSPALPNEGVWQTLAKVHGLPAMRAAYLRPDARHTSYTSAIVRMDQHLLSTIYHPGTDQPGGGPWKLPPDLSGPRRVNLLAAYNSAFRLGDANGGFYNEGRTVAPLRPGAASMVLYADGHVDVGSWGSEVSMSRGVVSLRQNLLLVVDGGKVVPTINDNTGQRWGKTISYKAYVWRTGVGIAANGDVVFAAGNSLSAATLAELLRRGGAVRAMELDINPAWTSFNLYNSAASPQTNERKLLPDMQPSVARYDTPSSRDFYAVYARP